MREFLVWVVLPIVAATFIIYTSFFALATAKRILAAGIKLPWDMKAVAYVLLVIGYPADVFYNFTRGSWMFRELPHELTFSSRVQRHCRNQTSSSNRALALRWAELLNVADENHIRW